MKKLIQASTLFALLASSAFAQALVEVPFDFNVGEKKMSAGSYTVSPASNSGAQFFLRERKTGRTTLVSAPVPLADKGTGMGSRRLVFQCRGGCQLKEVWASPSLGGGRMPGPASQGITIEGR